ncbi:MAG: SGNH/GDSL hydrolase family protein [Hyphomicrobiales bacterium]|nr:SGNH/GDSL hydrolase family protein [Hyphomicrobiales bacterium]
MSWFHRNPIKTIAAIVILFFSGAIALTEWLLTPSGGTVELKGLSKSLAPPRALHLREWPPRSTHTYRSPKVRYSDPKGPVDDFYKISIDGNGFIEPAIRHAQPDLEIAFLGGSTTECLYMRPDERFPALAAQMLERRTGLKINGLNAARSGNNTMHSVVNYLGKVAPRRPGYVVLMHAANDIGALTKHDTYLGAPGTIALLRSRNRGLTQLGRDFWAITIPQTYTGVSRGVRVLKLVAEDLWTGEGDRPPAAQPANAQAEQAEQVETEPPAPSEAEIERRKAFRLEYEAALRSFVRLAKAWGSQPVLMTQVLVERRPGSAAGAEGDLLAPEQLRRGDFDSASFESTHAYANALVRHVAKTEGALLIDLAAARQWTGEDVYDGIHFTATGAKRVAELIAGAIGSDVEGSTGGNRGQRP